MATISNRNVRYLAVLIFLTDVVVLVAVLILLWTMAQSSDGQDCAKLCLPCKADNREICCGCHVETLQTFIQKEFEESIEEEKARDKVKDSIPVDIMKYWDVSWNVKPTAHLTGSKIQLTPDDLKKPLSTVKQWDKDGNNCFLQNGISYRNGRLVVPVSGLYHLYGFLDIYQDYNDDLDMPVKKPNAITMSFYKSNILKQEEEILLLTNRPYEKSMNNRYMVHESFLSGDVNLEAGDEVYVKVSNLKYLKNPSKNNFGIHMI